MAIESIIETPSFTDTFFAGSGTMTIAEGSTQLDLSTNTDVNEGGLIRVTDDNGKVVFFAIAEIITSVQLRVTSAATSAVTAKSFEYISFPAGSSSTPVVDQSPYFIANNGDNKAPVFNTLFYILKPKAEFDDYIYFSKDEGVLLKSLYARLPYQFTLADSTISVRLWYWFTNDTLGNIDTIGEGANTFTHLVSENLEIPVNAYIPAPVIPTGAEDKWALVCEINSIKPSDNLEDEPSNYFASISQVDAPDVLNGKLLPIAIGARIQHASVQMDTL